MYIYILNLCAIYLKLTQYCKLTVLQFLKLKINPSCLHHHWTDLLLAVAKRVPYQCVTPLLLLTQPSYPSFSGPLDSPSTTLFENQCCPGPLCSVRAYPHQPPVHQFNKYLLPPSVCQVSLTDLTLRWGDKK